MTNCNNIKRLIDEAEQADVLSFEANDHLNFCSPCRKFADERANLRGLLNAMPRINAPINFDAQLKARMTTAKAKPTFAWSSPALYLRFGAASAALLVAVFAAQYNGMFSLQSDLASTGNTPSVVTRPPTQTNDQRSSSGANPGNTTKEEPTVNPSAATATPTYNPSSNLVATSGRGDRRVRPVAVTLEDEAMADRVPGLIVRPRSGREVELPMLPVSLGAQQQLINRSSRSSVQPIAISF